MSGPVSHAAYVLVEGRGFVEHGVHRRDAGGVPRADVLVEGRRGTRSRPPEGVPLPSNPAALAHHDSPQHRYDMSVTPDVCRAEMWPYVASAAARSEIHAATAVLIVVVRY